jgi:hypothetical protein
MEQSAATQALDLGRLLRMQAMVTQAAQVEATYQAGGALARAYLSLREEMLRVLEPDALVELRKECERLFPVIEEPPDYSHTLPRSTAAKLSTAANEAQLGLRKLQGWIQGLIDELTYEDRLRVEAEVRAAQASKPPMGFRQQ